MGKYDVSMDGGMGKSVVLSLILYWMDVKEAGFLVLFLHPWIYHGFTMQEG